jgi:hypothetical protein
MRISYPNGDPLQSMTRMASLYFLSVVAARNSADHHTRVRHVFDAKAVIASDHYCDEILIPSRRQVQTSHSRTNDSTGRKSKRRPRYVQVLLVGAETACLLVV